MRINVTPRDIRLGISHHVQFCPVARAVVRHAMDRGWVLVDSERIMFDNLDFETPVAAREWLKRFDEGKPVSPISFELKEEA